MKRLLKAALRRIFEVGQRFGVDVLPRHFYSEIPDIVELRSDSTWRRPNSLVGVRGAQLDQQLAYLAAWCPPAVVASTSGVYAEACLRNDEDGYGPIEAQLLYCFIRTLRPQRVIQIGGGVTTAVMLRAGVDAGYALDLTCVEPYPSQFLRNRAAAGEIDLIAERAQVVELARLTALASGDFLFVDSTHTVKPGSEVNRLVLEVLPRLVTGCFIHFHDIQIPYDYSPSLLTSDLFFWNETVLLHAFLIYNSRYALRVSMSAIHHADPGAMQRVLPSYRPARMEDGVLVDAVTTRSANHFPTATYLEVVGHTSGLNAE